MAADFERFIDAVTSGTALDARAPGQRFAPPPAPAPSWHAVRDDLEDTLANLQQIRQALLALQGSLDEARSRLAAGQRDARAGDAPDGSSPAR
jgi:hypothetical protein